MAMAMAGRGHCEREIPQRPVSVSRRALNLGVTLQD